MKQPICKNETIYIETPPVWLSPELAQRLYHIGPKVYSGRLSRAERQILKRKEEIKPSAWSERFRVLTMSILSGKWRNETTPYSVGIMDASFFESVRKIILCKGPQSGGSEAVHNCIGYGVDIAPGPVLYTYPDETTSKENNDGRVQPMFKASGRLKKYLTGRRNDLTDNCIKLTHVPIYFAWARSPSRLGNKPIKYAVSDEVDKYPDTAGKRETGPLELIEKRMITYSRECKHWIISTPTIESGPVWTEFNDAQARFDFAVKCPDCGTFQVMKFEQIKWPESERDPNEIEQKRLAVYVCEHCKAKWDDYRRDQAVRGGHWIERKTGEDLFDYLERMRPISIAFHLPAWLSYFVSLSKIAAAFLKSTGDKTKLKDFKNNFEAVPWLSHSIGRAEEPLRLLRDDRQRGEVPGDNQVATLTAGVDTQLDGFWYEVRAWSWGDTQESWQIREGKALTFEILAGILWDDVYKDIDGCEYKIQLAIIDAMGGVERQTAGIGTRTSEVYDFCRKHIGKIHPYQGFRTMSEPWRFKKHMRYPDGRPMKGPIGLVQANTNYYKYELERRLDVAPADPGAWHYHKDTTEVFLSHMTAETTDEKGYWINPHNRPNHGFDCSVLNLIAKDILGVVHWRKRERKPPKPPPVSAEDARKKLNKHGWVSGGGTKPRSGWMNL